MEQFIRARPFDRLSLRRSHRAFPAAADVKRHEEMKLLVGVARESEGLERGGAHSYSKLLGELANERLLRPFVGIELTSRKLPKAGELFTLRPLRDEHATFRVDERSCNHKEKFQRPDLDFLFP
jgi:hypothetical protein